MIRTQGYTGDTSEKTGQKVKWVTPEEPALRQRGPTDNTTNGGQSDIVTIGM